MTASLRVTKPQSMDLDCLIEWSKNAAAAAHEKCSEAEAYFNAMKVHYGNVTQLLERLQVLREERDRRTEQEEAQEIVETLTEVMEAMDALTREQFAEGVVSLEEE